MEKGFHGVWPIPKQGVYSWKEFYEQGPWLKGAFGAWIFLASGITQEFD
jgi:hypothetical protein